MYDCHYILHCRFANFSITFNDICHARLNDQPALRGNIGHSKASLTPFPPLRVRPAP
jgi:hypothetical protein